MKNKKEIINTIVQNIYDECQVDFEGLWGILYVIKWEKLAIDPIEIRQITLDIVRKLLEKGIVAGRFEQKQPIIFNISKDEVIAMIDREWTKLSQEPSIGDIVSFASPELAKEIIEYSQEKH